MGDGIQPFTRVTVFGGVTIDRIAASGAPPVASASNPGTIRTLPGGVGLNVAAALGRLGREVRLVARVGADPDGEAIIAAAGAAGVDTSAIGVSPTTPTARYIAALDNAGGLMVGISDMAICEEMTPAAVAPAARAARQDELWLVDANLPAETLAFLVGEAASARRPIAAVAVSPAKATRLSRLLDRLTILFATRREAAALLHLAWSGTGPPAAALARDISSRLTPNVVITNASDPLAVARYGEVRSFAPLRAEVRSVNGAGDALAAGTIHGLAAGRDFFEAVIFGLAAAALKVETEGPVGVEFNPAALAARIADRAKRSDA
jgi:pseudouridine kinase